MSKSKTSSDKNELKLWVKNFLLLLKCEGEHDIFSKY